MSYDPFVQYTIKSETSNGEVYTLSGELVLVDTGVIRWWQSLGYAIFAPIVVLVLGQIIIPRIRKDFQSRKAKRGVVPLD
jgi:S1-C subfamily serine protease